MLVQAAALAALLGAPFPLAVPAQAAPTEIALREAGPAIPDGPRRCAAYDLHVLWLIEEHAEAQELDGDAIAAAAHALGGARRLCASGRVAEALEAYGAIALARPRSRWFR